MAPKTLSNIQHVHRHQQGKPARHLLRFFRLNINRYSYMLIQFQCLFLTDFFLQYNLLHEELFLIDQLTSYNSVMN